MRPLLPALVLLGLVSAQSPPLNVAISVNEIPRTVTGRITVSWAPPSSGPPDGYTVTVAPLNYVDSLADPLASGFIFSAGGAPNSVSAASPGITLVTHTGHALVANGRGTWPLALRKAPVNATVTATIDCSGMLAPAVGAPPGSTPGWLCGLAIYDGGSNATLFMVGLVMRGGVLAAEALAPGFNPGIFTRDGVVLRSVATQTGGGSWGSAGTRVTVVLNRVLARSWTATVSLVSAPAGAVTLTFEDTSLPSTGRAMGGDADLWHAAIAGGFGAANTATATSAKVLSWGMSMAVPSTPPRTLLGLPDMCIAPFVGVAPVTVTVPKEFTSTYITGLSGTFPYTVTVTASFSSVLYESAPIPGVYFYARHMPPRSAALGAWYDSRVFSALPTAAFPSTWPDSSGRSHDLVQPNRVAPLSPLPTLTGAPTPWSYQRVTFSRARGTFMLGGYDVLDLGIGGNFTAYSMSLSQSYTPQVLFGRGGAPATTIFGSTPGYAVSIYPTSFNPAPAWQGIKASDGYSPTVYPAVSNYVAFYGTNTWILQPAIFAFSASTLQSGNPSAPQVMNYTAGRTIPVYPGAPAGWSNAAGAVMSGAAAGMVRLPDASGNWTTQGLPGVAWQSTGAAFTASAGSAPAFSPLGGSPNVNAGGAFRLGGPPNGAGTGTGNPTFAFQGDLYQVLLYSETHTLAQQAAITQWLRSYTFDSSCGYGLPSVTGMTSTDQSGAQSLAGYCSGQYGGILNGGCWQTCAANYGVFTGAIWAHYCTNGEWSGAPLVCRMQCPNAQPPLYASPTLCSRNIVSDSLDSNVTTGLTYVAYPTMPRKQLLSTWNWVAPGLGVPSAGPGVNATGGTFGGYLESLPWYNDTCASMTARAFSIYGFSPDRWTDRLTSYVPWGSTGNVTVSIQLVGPGATGGIAVRITSATSHYRVVLTEGGGGVRLFRSVNGVITAIPGGIAWSNITVYPAPVWHSLSVSYNNGQFNASLDGVMLFSVIDTVTPFFSGAPGMYAAAPWPSLVRFDNLRINGACDAFGQGVSVLEGMNVTHACLVGYTPVGNATRMCRTTPAVPTLSYDGNGNVLTTATRAAFPGSYDSPGLTCLSKPPTFLNNFTGGFTFGLLDRSANGTNVGIAQALPANPAQTLSYSIVGVTVTSPKDYVYQGSLFSIVACSGVIRVNSSTSYSLLLDSVYIQNVTVTVMVVPDGQTLAAAFANVTVYLIPVLLPPQALIPDGYMLSVDSGFVGPITGSSPAGPLPAKETFLISSGVAVYNHNSLPLVWSIIGGASSFFSINATSGAISTTPPGVSYASALSFSAPGENVTLIIIVQVADLNDPTNRFSDITVPVVINEVHQPPYQQDYVFSIAAASVNAGQLVGVLYNNNPTLNVIWQPKNMAIESVSYFSNPDSSDLTPGSAPFAPLQGTFLQTGAIGGPWTSNVAFATKPTFGTPFSWPPPSLLQPSTYTSAVYILNVSTTDGAGLGAASVYYSRVEVRVLYDNSQINGTAPSLTAVFPSPPSTLPTAGGSIIELYVSNLPINTADLNITVGSLGTLTWPNVMGTVECPLCDQSGALIARTPGAGTPSYINTAYMTAAGVKPTLQTQATLYCILPPGQGTQPLTVSYATPNPVTQIVSMFPLDSRLIYYDDPVITTASVWVREPGSAPGSGLGTLGESTTNGTLFAPPSLFGAIGSDGRLVRSARVDGINFGLCPVLTLSPASPLVYPQTQTVIKTCDQSGVPNTAAGVVHSHSFIEFPAPPGTGASWTLTVSVGQPYCSDTLCPDLRGVKVTAPIPWSYEAPAPVAIAPLSGACSSATPVTVTFDFLGPLGAPLPCVALYNSLLNLFLPPRLDGSCQSMCTSRVGDSQLLCTIPGSGVCGRGWVPYAESVQYPAFNSNAPIIYKTTTGSLAKTPSVFPIAGSPLPANEFLGYNFSFAPPIISQIGFGQWIGGIPPTRVTSPSSPGSSIIVRSQVSGGGSLVVPPNPNFAEDVVFLTGSNFGAFNFVNSTAPISCIFASWVPATLAPCSLSGLLPHCNITSGVLNLPCCTVPLQTPMLSADIPTLPLPFLSREGGTLMAQGPLSCLSGVSSGAPFEAEDFIGEGQIFSGDIVYFADDFIALRAPPGAGSLVLTTRVYGQGPVDDNAYMLSYAALALAPPFSTSLVEERLQPVAPSFPGAPSPPSSGDTSGGGTVFIPLVNVPRNSLYLTSLYASTPVPYAFGNYSILRGPVPSPVSPEAGIYPYDSVYTNPPPPYPLPISSKPPPSSPAWTYDVVNGTGWRYSGFRGVPLSLGDLNFSPYFPTPDEKGLYQVPQRLPLRYQAPTETVVVLFGSRCLAPIGTYLPGAGSPAVAGSYLGTVSFPNCSDTPVNTAITPSNPMHYGAVMQTGPFGVTVSVPPGVGVNKPVNVLIVSAAQREPIAVSPTFYFNYTKPRVIAIGKPPRSEKDQSSSVLELIGAVESLVRIPPSSNLSSGSADTRTLRILGENFGIPTSAWTEAERKVDVTIAGIPCDPESRFGLGVTPNPSAFSCTLSSSDLSSFAVGPASTTIMIAGQLSTLDADSDDFGQSLYFGCDGPKYVGSTLVAGGYGFRGELCLPCPTGALCRGVVEDLTPSSSKSPCKFGPIAQKFIPACNGTNTTMWVTPCCNGYTADDLVDNKSNVTFGKAYTRASPTSPLEEALPYRAGLFQFDVATNSFNTYPEVLAGFWNMNGTTLSLCPPLAIVPGRDVCIVPCVPDVACTGNNFCAIGYTSVAPNYRCSTCATGYFPSGNACIKCPNSAAAVFVLFILVIAAIAALGYILNKYDVNPGLVSIGIDYAQTLSIASSAKVPWPPELLELFKILSAFNLNIQIIAPECFIPNVSFTTKFIGVVLMPLILAAVLLWQFYCRLLIYRARRGKLTWKMVQEDVPHMLSVMLLIFYLAYLSVTKAVMDVYTCVPTVPPDGNLYLIAAGVSIQCNVPGGTQQMLLVPAIIATVFYVIGYPAFLTQLLWRNKELIMEDQLLRAKGTGFDALSNPNAHRFRIQYGRLYYLFRPKHHMWILVILLRKVNLAIATLLFSSNVAFQLAFALLVLFLSYAAQVRYLPFMSGDEHTAVIKEHLALVRAGDALHVRLNATLASVEARGRKQGVSNLLRSSTNFMGRSRFTKVLTYALNYNTVDATLLFSATCVLLSGILFVAAVPTDPFYQDSRNGILGVVLTLVICSVIYWVFAMGTDLTTQLTRARAFAAAATASRGGAESKAMAFKKLTASMGGSTKRKLMSSGVDVEKIGVPQNVFTEGFERDSKEHTASNPLFAKSSGEAIITGSQVVDTVRNMTTPPDEAVWMLMRGFFIEQHESMQALTASNTMLKEEAARLLAAVPEDDEAQRESARKALRSTRRREFDDTAPRARTTSVTGVEEEDEPANPTRITGPTFASPRPGSGGGNAGRSPLSVASLRGSLGASPGSGVATSSPLAGLAGYRAATATGSSPLRSAASPRTGST